MAVRAPRRLDGRGRWMDNVFIERLWRSLKYEDVYPKGYAKRPRG
jgi:putative transposase